DRLRSSRFVGDPDRVVNRVVGQTIWIVTRRSLPEPIPGVLVEDHQSVDAGGGGVHPVQGRDDENTVDLVDVLDDTYDPVRVHVHLDDLAGTEVRDEQQSAVGVDARVVVP